MLMFAEFRGGDAGSASSKYALVFNHVFVCKHVVIQFGVLFVLKCSFCYSFLFVVDICLLTDVCSFKVAILFLRERSWS